MKSKKRVFIFLGAVITLLWLLTPILLFQYFGKMDERGQFGDMFGAVNALFSGLALLGAVYAIMLQTEELELQRKELQKSTAEFAAQNEILREQLESARASQRAAEAKERLASMPFLSYRGGTQDGSQRRDEMRFENAGGDIYDLSVTTEGNVVCNALSPSDIWRNSQQAALTFTAAPGAKLRGQDWAFTFHFTTKTGSPGTVRFIVDKTGSLVKKDQ